MEPFYRNLLSFQLLFSHTVVDPTFMGPEAYKIWGALFKKKNTKLCTKVNIYLGLLPGPSKGLMQVKGPEASLASQSICP